MSVQLMIVNFWQFLATFPPQLLRMCYKGLETFTEHVLFKVGLSFSKKSFFYLLFKNDEKCFFFHLKSFFCSQDI